MTRRLERNNRVMIDLHSHILPGIDDGAPDLQMSLKLADRYTRAGYRYVVATPHALVWSMKDGYADAVREAVVQFNAALQLHAIDLEVLSGMEVTLDTQLPALMARKEVLPLAGMNYLLVETPFGRMPLGWQQLVFELGTLGITVMFAHPERCVHIMKAPDILTKMVDCGAKLQVNWDSFGGFYGQGPRRLARYMADEGLIHCLATDSHDPQNRHPGRVYQLCDDVTARVGSPNLKRICKENPIRVLRGMPLLDMDAHTIPVRKPKKHKWWKWLPALQNTA